MWKKTQGICKERLNAQTLCSQTCSCPADFRPHYKTNPSRKTSLSFIQNGSSAMQQLTERDCNVRQTACESLLEGLPPDALVFFSDKTHFHISGCVNKQNRRYWGGDNPQELHEKPLHCERVTVWCAFSKVMIIGPYFFEENNRINNFVIIKNRKENKI